MRYTFEYVNNKLQEFGYTYVSGEFVGIASKLTCVDKDGYYVLCNIQKMLYEGKRPRIIDASNPYSIINIKRIVKEKTNGEYECISDNYKKNNDLLRFKHNKCGREFETKWINVYRSRYNDNYTDNKLGLFCPHCDVKQLESTHAIVLKQVWLHEEPDTVVEDRSCINPNTNCALPTDIVNHRLKIAIEVQSWFHDFPEQKKKDKIKRNYWLANGYKFFAVDQRDYSVVDMIKIFFKNIDKIPEYVDFNYAHKFNDVLAQNLLNKYLSVTKVADEMGCNPHIIYDAIQYGRISYPKTYIRNDASPIVQLDLNKNIVKEYDSIQSAINETGIMGISACLQKNRNYSGGFYWIYKKDHNNGNYKISTSRFEKFMVPVLQFSIDREFIKKFETIKEASEELGITNTMIYNVAIGKNHSSKNYIWKFAT